MDQRCLVCELLVLAAQKRHTGCRMVLCKAGPAAK